MHARGEYLTDRIAIVRVWHDAPRDPGPMPAEPYAWACVVTLTSPASCEVKIGWPGCTPGIARAVVDWIRREGMREWTCRRVEGNGFSEVRHRLRK